MKADIEEAMKQRKIWSAYFETLSRDVTILEEELATLSRKKVAMWNKVCRQVLQGHEAKAIHIEG